MGEAGPSLIIRAAQLAAHGPVTDRDSDDARWSRLAQEAAAGEPASIRQLTRDLLPRVRNLVRYLVRGDRDVDDLSQDALLLILEGMQTYRGDGPFRSWADRVVARSVFAARRSSARRSEQPVDEAVLAAEPSTLPDRYYLRRQVAERLDALPLAQRDALVLHCVVGLRVAEVAAELGVPEETVRSRLRLGKDRLRQQLSDPSPAPGALGSDDDANGRR